MSIEEAISADTFSEVSSDVPAGDTLSSDSDGPEFSDDELSGSDDEPQTKEEIKAEIKKLRKLTIKYNGKDYEEELPFEIEDTPEAVDYMKKQLQLARLSQSKSQNYSQLEGEVRSFIEELRTNPRKALANPNIGIDLKQLAADVLQEEMENSAKSPEQLEKERLELRLRELEGERAQEKEEVRKREYERTLNQEYERYDIAMSQALEGSDLPKSPYIVKKMADYMMLGIKNGLKVEPKDVLPIVREEMHSDLKEMFAVMPAEVIEKMMGNETYDKVRKYRLTKARGGKGSSKSSAATNKSVKDVGSSSKSTSKQIENSQSFKDFFGV